uniref:SEFIR domain-containing protein n=1 Tax=Oryzias sinensis TaxID=183150 RepID=A0A8C7XAF0_9TELE
MATEVFCFVNHAYFPNVFILCHFVSYSLSQRFVDDIFTKYLCVFVCVHAGNCMDPEWLKVKNYTPSAPEKPKVLVVAMTDDEGRRQAVLQAQWEIKDDGSISYLLATELHLLTISTGRNDCLRFSFKGKLPQRDPSGKKVRKKKCTNIFALGDHQAVYDLDILYQTACLHLLSCVVLAAAGWFLCRRKGILSAPSPPLCPFVLLMAVCVSGKAFPPEPPQDPEMERLEPLLHPPKVLVIYSQDHRLYRDVVLKLCAFLQAKCGTKVLVDLLDSSSVSMVGRVRWLEWQRQQLRNPSDKILVLCSPGVQAKWRAMCGLGRVTLREDVLSPTDDMLIPFLNLFLSDMHQAGMLGKYLVAYFEDISSAEDVPSVFNIAAKYSLMKHFEELFFRLLDMEKYQPDRINHILGIGEEEYSSSPSGRALKEAIQVFKAFQQENPDWFEKECVESEEDVTVEVQQVEEQIPAVLECVPAIRDGPPVYACDVSVTEACSSVLLLSPELRPPLQAQHVVELLPAVLHHPQHLASQVLLPPHPTTPQLYIHEPILDFQSPSGGTWLSLEERILTQSPAEDDEDASAPSVQAFPEALHFPSVPDGCSIPEEVDEEQEDQLEPNRKGPRSGSDQGYISNSLTAS